MVAGVAGIAAAEQAGLRGEGNHIVSYILSFRAFFGFFNRYTYLTSNL